MIIKKERLPFVESRSDFNSTDEHASPDKRVFSSNCSFNAITGEPIKKPRNQIRRFGGTDSGFVFFIRQSDFL